MAEQTVTLPGGQKIGFQEIVAGVLAQIAAKPNDVTVSGTLTATSGSASEVVQESVDGLTMITAWFHGTYGSATVVMEASFNGGVSWMPLFGGNVGSGAVTTTPLSLNTNSLIGWEAPVPAGVTHLRAHCTAITSGTVEVTLAQGGGNYETVMGAVCAAGANTIGSVFTPGQWTDISSTTLAENASMAVPASIDLLTTATATNFNNSSIGAGEIRVSATANVTGTLFLENSRDNATFKKIKSVKLAQAEGCEFFGEIQYRPSTRWMRVAFTNGAAAQTFFSCQMIRCGMA